VARAVRADAALRASRELASKIKCAGETSTIPFGSYLLELRRATNHHAERAALALAGHIAECASADEWEDLARLAVTVLSRIDRSPISQHFAARAPVVAQHDVAAIAQAFRREWVNIAPTERERFNGKRAVILALRAVAYPKPTNVFSRDDKRRQSSTRKRFLNPR
jgi:hypothetical protein